MPSERFSWERPQTRSGKFRAIRFRPGISASRVAEKHWHPSQTLEPQPDGSLIVRFQVTDLREIKGWVLSWGKDCEALEPEEFRTAMRVDSAVPLAPGRPVGEQAWRQSAPLQRRLSKRLPSRERGPIG
jgi:predicted DNA-binding transcriptional regulator YafY